MGQTAPRGQRKGPKRDSRGPAWTTSIRSQLPAAPNGILSLWAGWCLLSARGKSRLGVGDQEEGGTGHVPASLRP